jgi:hypothetical protein
MFVLREESTFDWSVKAHVPMGGKKSLVKFEATFNVLDQEAIEELVINPETRNVQRFLESALVSFTGIPVQDADGNEIEDADERNRIIRRNPIFADALVEAYAEGVSGHKAKN